MSLISKLNGLVAIMELYLPSIVFEGEKKWQNKPPMFRDVYGSSWAGLRGFFNPTHVDRVGQFFLITIIIIIIKKLSIRTTPLQI